MSNRFPLIVDSSTNRIKELPATDNLDLTSSNISNVVGITATGNITASYFLGNGSQLTGITAATVTGNSQPNITSVGTLTSLTANGNISLSNGNSNITIPTANGNINISSGGTPNELVITNTGIVVAGNANIVNTNLVKFGETVIAGGNANGTITPNAAAGTIYNYTLTGNITLSSLANVVAGTSMTIILTQDNVGNRLLTSTMKFAGNVKTLSTTANTTDIMCVFYDGSTYYASLTKGYV